VRHAKVRCARLWLTVVVIGAIVTMTVSAVADDEGDKGREIVDRWQSSVVTVKLVTQHRMVMRGQEASKSESKNEITGTIIDPSGLVVVSLYAADPSKLAEDMAAMAGGDPGFKIETETTDVKIRMADGKELPAKIILRDEDLDLAFVRTLEKPDEPMPAIGLSREAKLQLLERVVVINRLGTVASWATAVYFDRVHAVVEKPRTFYVPGGMGAMESELGCPAFNLDGKAVGILVLRVAPSAGGMGGMFGGMSSMGMLPIILPSEDILEVAKQAPETAE
jgi:S1-C subfamily serine protease